MHTCSSLLSDTLAINKLHKFWTMDEQMNSEIRRVMSTASNSSLQQSCSAFTSVTSALEVNFNVMRSINSRFLYLFYLVLRLFTTQ